MKNLVVLTILLLVTNITGAQTLKIVDQNYEEALSIAAQKDKLIFVDFYTSWCGPCKQLDKLIFQNDSLQQILGEHFVLLKYDAENDSIHHLSKKHHVMSYPTGLILSKDGFVINRKYGFPGEDFPSLWQSVSAFAERGVALNKEGKVVKGYSNQIDAAAYPDFYVDYVDRVNTKPDPQKFASYWQENHDVFSEGYFSTLLYFAGDKVPENVADAFLERKPEYVELYGESDVNIALMFLSYGRFEAAIKNRNRAAFDQAVNWVKEALPADWAGQIAENSEAEFLKAQKE